VRCGGVWGEVSSALDLSPPFPNSIFLFWFYPTLILIPDVVFSISGRLTLQDFSRVAYNPPLTIETLLQVLVDCSFPVRSFPTITIASPRLPNPASSSINSQTQTSNLTQELPLCQSLSFFLHPTGCCLDLSPFLKSMLWLVCVFFFFGFGWVVLFLLL